MPKKLSSRQAAEKILNIIERHLAKLPPRERAMRLRDFDKDLTRITKRIADRKLK